MAVEVTSGDLFDDDAGCLVNPVNCVGVMGAGLALQFARRWPDMLAGYRDACRTGELRPGRVHLWEAADAELWVANLPTKLHWREPSRYPYIHQGLLQLGDDLSERGVFTVAMPALGCGLGGLEFGRVLPMIRHVFGRDGWQVRVYVPRQGR